MRTVGDPVFASSVFMMQPESFGFNPQTAASNEFQAEKEHVDSTVQAEFFGVVEALAQNGVKVDVLPDDRNLRNPDAVFLNNWFSSHKDGTLVVYPMLSENRKAEVRGDIISYFQEMYEIRNVIDLRKIAEEKVLEGTGSLVFDHSHASVFLSPSERSNIAVALALTEELGYHLVPLKAVSRSSKPFYHTNIVVAVGSGFLLSCAESLENPGILSEYCANMGLEWIELSSDQIEHGFAGNGLQLTNQEGAPVFVLSERALKSLEASQIHSIEKHTSIVSSAIPTIESIGGGSIRCMMAECFWQAR